jgi:hypothetical protein
MDETKDRSRVTRLSSRLPRLAKGRPSPAAPAWPSLIVILLVGIGLFALSDILTPEGALRPVTDSLMVVLIFGAMAGWVRANRPALAQIHERERESSPLEIRYVASERHPRWHAETKGRRRERVRRKGVERS